MNRHEPEDAARLREAFASLQDEGGREAVDAERVFDAVHGDLGPEERQAVVEQLLTSPATAEAWRLANEMPPAAAESAAHRVPTRPDRTATWRWLPVAAVALLTVGLGWQFMRSRSAEEPVYRGVESRAIASALPDGAALSRAQPVLRWSGVDSARYRVRVLTPDLQVLEESTELPTPEYRISPDTLARIPPASRILWQVEARIPGEEVITSPTFMNQVP